jgi:myosin heavy subunit
MAAEKDYEDMCEMDILNEPEVLFNLVRRYNNDDIFTNIGATLISINPYCQISRLFNPKVL